MATEFYEVKNDRFNVTKIEINKFHKEWRITHLSNSPMLCAWHPYGILKITPDTIQIDGYTNGAFYNNRYQRVVAETILDGF